jgi:16S rRNA processing protein RimM
MTSSRRSASNSEPGEEVVTGRLVGPFGVRGEVKLLPLTDFPERLEQMRSLRLRLRGGDCEEWALAGIRPHKQMYVIRLDGCASVEDAEALRDAEVCVPESELPPLPQGEYYVHDIVGLRVVTEAGDELGTVDDVIRTGANDIYRVGRLMIPATRDAIVRLDPAAGVIVTRSRAYLDGEEVR